MRLMLFLIALCFGILLSCSSPKQPNFVRIDQFKLNSLSFDGIGLKFNVVFYNPNRYGLTVKSAETTVYIDSIYAGNFLQDSLVKISGNSEFSIPFSGKIPLAAFTKLNFKGLPGKEVLIKAEGKASIGKAGIYVVRDFFVERKERLADFKF